MSKRTPFLSVPSNTRTIRAQRPPNSTCKKTLIVRETWMRLTNLACHIATQPHPATTCAQPTHVQSNIPKPFKSPHYSSEPKDRNDSSAPRHLAYHIHSESERKPVPPPSKQTIRSYGTRPSCVQRPRLCRTAQHQYNKL